VFDKSGSVIETHEHAAQLLYENRG
jgi:hypothetical protein